ncbi:unnamed protein product [Camellia sinensis]
MMSLRTLSSLELPRAVAVATAPSSPISNGGPPPYENQERTEVGTFDGTARLKFRILLNIFQFNYWRNYLL